MFVHSISEKTLIKNFRNILKLQSSIHSVTKLLQSCPGLCNNNKDCAECFAFGTGIYNSSVCKQLCTNVRTTESLKVAGQYMQKYTHNSLIFFNVRSDALMWLRILNMYIFLWETQSCKKKINSNIVFNLFIKHQKTKKQIRPSHLNRVSQRTNINAL